MRISRLAIVALAVGSVLLGSSAAGVTAIAGDLPQASGRTAEHHHHDDRGHDSGRGL